MSKCRVLVHFNFKKGMEDKGVQIIEREIFTFLLKHGALSTELFQSAENPSHCYYAVDWNNMADAKRIQSEWENKTAELRNYCAIAPKREFFNLKSAHGEKGRRVA